MKILTVIAILVTCLVVTGAVWAQAPEAPKTDSLTNVIVSKGQGSGTYTGYWFYDFALVNNTSTLHPLNDGHINYVVLIDKMIVDQTNLLPNPAKVTSAEGWSWSANGWERYADTSCEKYNVGPSAGPGQTLLGFRYYYAGTLPTTTVSGISFSNHVLAVNPVPTGPFVYTRGDLKGDTYYHYDGVTVNLAGYGPQPTWYDKPGDDNGGHDDNSVPEASAFILGAMGLIGPMGYALKRKRYSK